VAELLMSPGTLRTGHYRLLSGLHTDTFFAFSAIAHDARVVRQITAWLAPGAAAWEPDLVLAPTTAGVTLAAGIARDLGVPLALTSLDEQSRAAGVLGQDDLTDMRVVLVNDAFTTGQGLRRLTETAAAAGGQVVGACWFLSRTRTLPDDLPPFVAVATAELPAWPEAECSMCAEGVPAEQAVDLN
jgi:orotate phosphoribosyltransferase